MSTTIGISVGPVSASRTFADDAKAATILGEFYLSQQLGPANATNQQKLAAIVDWTIRQIQEHAKARAVRVAQENAQTAADTELVLA